MQLRGQYCLTLLCATAFLTHASYAAVDRFEFDSISNSKIAPQFRARAASEDYLIDSTIKMLPAGSAERVLRLDSNLTAELDGLESRLRIGDSVATSESLGQTLRYGGLQLNANGEARQETGNESFMAFPRSKKCKDYSLGMGRAREEYGTASSRYGSMVTNATVGCTLNASLKLELHTEHEAGQVSATGVGVSKTLGANAKVAMAVAQSQSTVGTGWQARFKFEHNGEQLQVKLRARLRSNDYREVTAPTLATSNANSPQRAMMASVGTGNDGQLLPRGNSLSLIYSTEDAINAPNGLVTVRHQMDLSGRRSLSLTAGSSLGNANPTVRLAYSQPLMR